jgi:carbamoyltransferase
VHHRCSEVLLDFFSKYASSEDIISYTGGVAQNVVWNTEIRKKFPNLIIPPHCADEGLSLGGIEWLRIKNNLPKFYLENFPYCQLDQSANVPTDETIYKTAKLLAEGNTVGWYQGHGEIGPRALGNRSILLNPLLPNGKFIVNTVKNREEYRPFGASVLEEHASEYFELDHNNPFMLYVAKVKTDKLAAITHIDGTCRIQTVNEKNLIFQKLLQAFYEITGCPILLNTSLNIAGKPLAGHYNDALQLYNAQPLNCLVIGDQIYQK